MKIQRRLMKSQLSKRFLLALVPLMLHACGVSDNAVQTQTPPEVNAATPEVVETATIQPTPESQASLPENTPTAEISEELMASNPLLIFPGMLEMENLVPASGGGARPRLEWQAVESAVYYNIVVYEPDGTPYWAWRTKDTSVYVAGIDAPLPEEYEGPVIAVGMTWQVIAENEDQAPIAVGGPWPIAP